MHWIDSHCHLQDEYRPADAAAMDLADESLAAGVSGLVCVGTDAASSRQAVALAEDLRSGLPTASRPGGVERHSPARGPSVTRRGPFGAWATIGLHPHEASAGTSEVEAVLAGAVKEHPGVVVAVGECGLDYHYDNSPRSEQRDAFVRQIALARENQLALVVHSRDSWSDTLDIMESECHSQRIVFHCFTGGPPEARRCLDLGAYLSFSGIVTFKNASVVRDAVRTCPLDRMLVETDAPFLSPVPHRGAPNRPAWVSIVGKAVAQIKSVPEAEIAASTVSSTCRAFALEDFYL